MHRLLLLFGLLAAPLSIPAQPDNIRVVESRVDSILDVIRRTPGGEPRMPHLLSLYASGVEGYPLMTLETYNVLSDMARQDRDQVTDAVAWSFAGQGYRLSGNYIKGLECHLQAVAEAEQSQSETAIALTLNQMGHIYKDREENEKALRLYLQSLSHARKSSSEEIVMWPMMNAGAIYLAINQLDSSLYYSQAALARANAKNIFANDSYLLSNIAAVYSKKGDQTKARTYYDKAIREALRTGSPRYVHLTYQSLAEHFRRLGEIDSSVVYARKAIDAVQHTVHSYLCLKPARLLTELYQEIDADSTLKYLKIYTAANDSLFSTRANQQLQMMTYEEEKRQQLQATEQLRNRNKFRTSLLLVGLLAFTAVALVLYRGNRQQRRANRALQDQKDELQRALAQLTATQAQLVHAEKMASLGELTAGIAHEIKNPLNFVNNFAEVSGELFEELKDTADPAQRAELIAMLQENLEKINEHGKRADAIVKSMLQHSRSGTGAKEPTDLNALIDEYLRLAYHGLRAKDKSFNATFAADLDPALPAVDVVPQDIGRVLLNLINNAFQAVAEKQKSSTGNYAPHVLVSTRAQQGKVIIRVADNGPGIPASITDKIFQPFFTTKPTGQGTGLGLSLSYDIVKAHGGSLDVEATDEGAAFIIQLTLSA
jgi:signal transduction histidine kinase